MIRHRGSNFTTAFDAVLADAGVRTVLCNVPHEMAWLRRHLAASAAPMTATGTSGGPMDGPSHYREAERLLAQAQTRTDHF
jgi:hypothetical protein